MHERTRRNLCRLAFLALGVLPTCCVVVWTGYRSTPWFARAERQRWESRIEERTGLVASVGALEYPRGSTVLLKNIELKDPEGSRTVARIRCAEIASRPEGTVILLSQPEVLEGMFLRLWDRLHGSVLQGRTPDSAVQLTTGECTLEVGARAQTFKTIRCTLEPDPRGMRVGMDFQLAGREMPTPAQLTIVRDHTESPAVTHWQLKTDVPLPCEIFTAYLPALAKLGDRSEFQGVVAASIDRAGVSAQISGQFQHVDLGALTESLPHAVKGTGFLGMERILVERGVIREASGRVECSDGVISSSLLSSLVQNLPLSTPEGVVLASHSPLTRFDRLAFRFALSEQGCAIAAMEDASEGEILRVAGRPLLRTNDNARYPLVAVARALSPDSRYLVPATAEFQGLLSWFPLPPTSARPNRLRLSARPE